MSRKISIVLLITLFITIPLFGAVTEEPQIPEGLRNNEFFRESLRLTRLAQETFEYGDYDASAGFAEEAIRYAELSDEHIANQLLAEARRLVAFADNNNIANLFPNNYNEARNQYEAAAVFHSNEEWSDAIDAAMKSISILAAFETTRTAARPGTTTGTTTTTTTATGTRTGTAELVRQYTVRTWRVERDCLWNIAGYPWVYGDPWRWRELYEANKHKMPDPNNPDLIEPGMILDIPSIRGETRQGMYRP
jgi:nucleoid-associated protein YgaU